MRTKVINTIAVEFEAEEIHALKKIVPMLEELTSQLANENFEISFADNSGLDFTYDFRDVDTVAGFIKALADHRFTIE